MENKEKGKRVKLMECINNGIPSVDFSAMTELINRSVIEFENKKIQLIKAVMLDKGLDSIVSKIERLEKCPEIMVCSDAEMNEYLYYDNGTKQGMFLIGFTHFKTTQTNDFTFKMDLHSNAFYEFKGTINDCIKFPKNP